MNRSTSGEVSGLSSRVEGFDSPTVRMVRLCTGTRPAPISNGAERQRKWRARMIANMTEAEYQRYRESETKRQRAYRAKKRLGRGLVALPSPPPHGTTVGGGPTHPFFNR